ncbi:hypothetical protein GCM10023157_32770 [Gluconacetobacter asukensis]
MEKQGGYQYLSQDATVLLDHAEKPAKIEVKLRERAGRPACCEDRNTGPAILKTMELFDCRTSRGAIEKQHLVVAHAAKHLQAPVHSNRQGWHRRAREALQWQSDSPRFEPRAMKHTQNGGSRWFGAPLMHDLRSICYDAMEAKKFYHGVNRRGDSVVRIVAGVTGRTLLHIDPNGTGFLGKWLPIKGSLQNYPEFN